LRKREWVDNYLRAHPCVDCGESDIVVLQFDHRDPAEKEGAVLHMTSIKRMESEVAKCDVRCAHCHIRRHHRERISRQ